MCWFGCNNRWNNGCNGWNNGCSGSCGRCNNNGCGGRNSFREGFRQGYWQGYNDALWNRGSCGCDHDGNSNARIYRIRWRFCCLYVSYSSIFIPIQHFSRLI